jgi:NADH-ubiquinone oxidoreductase chain 5
MYLNILFLPFLLIIIIGIYGRYIGIRGLIKIINIIMMIMIILIILLIYEYLIDGNIIEIMIWEGIKTDILKIEYKYILDELSQYMLMIIITITYIVLIYSYDYMINDPHIIRFYLYIIIFIFFMIILISTTSLPILFIGWEGVGISSYLLISFWYTRFETQLGALIAIIMNRLGDTFYLFGIFILFVWLGSIDIIIINSNYIYNLDFILIIIFLAAMTKSAQLYLHLWLPYSMEGPTPISALIHAATMVTAGVFLILRLNILIYYSYYTIIFIIIIGTLTVIIGGLLAISSFDIKELIAYSTMSQLGYMIVIIGIKFNNLSFFHLIFHAYFKALLFLTAGAIIHTIFDLQDFRKTGGLINFLPFISITTFIGSFSLLGFPFTTGYYSKEQILNNSFICLSLLSHYSYIILFIGALITIFYSYRFYLMIFINNIKLSLFNLKYIHFYSIHLFISLFILSFFTIFIGFFFSKYIHFFNYLTIHSFSFDIPYFIKLLPLIFIFIIFILVFFIKGNYYYNLYSYINEQFSFKLLYIFISGYFFSIGYRVFFKLFDYGILDLLSSISGNNLINLSKIYSKFISNNTNNDYFLSLFLFSILLLLL